MKPLCDNLINVATDQYYKSIQTSNVTEASSAAAVFDFLENLQQISNEAYQKEIIRMNDTMKEKLKDVNQRQANSLQIIKDTILILPIYASRVNTIYQTMLSRIALGKSNSYDLKPLEPFHIVESFSTSFQSQIESIARKYPKISTDISTEIPSIRQTFVSVIDRLPDSINRQDSLTVLSSSIVPFQDSFISTLDKEMRQKLSQLLNGKSDDLSILKVFCDDLKTKMLSYDSGLVLALKSHIIKLASDYQGLKARTGQQISIEAMKHSPVLCKGLVEICNKFCQDESAKEVEKILNSLPPPSSPAKGRR